MHLIDKPQCVDEVRTDFATPAASTNMDLLIVSPEDAKQILADIMNPPEPNEALRNLMSGYRKPQQ